MDPMISVIVPVYNTQQYLRKCLDSILLQSYGNLEIILIDDGSKDNSGQICDWYAQADPRVRVIHQPNSGIGPVRNMGIREARADYIMFVDSDDYLAPDCVEVLYDRMTQEGSDLVVGKHVDVCPDGTVLDSYCDWFADRTFTGQQILESMGDKKRIAVVSWAKLYKKALFADISYPDLACGEDLWVFPTVIGKCEKVSTVDKLVYYYYRRPTSIMRVYNARSARDNLEANLHMARRLWDLGIQSGTKKWFLESIYRAYNVSDEKIARELLRAYFAPKTTVKLLLRQNPKTCMIWLAVYLPFIKRIVLWLKEKGIKK